MRRFSLCALRSAARRLSTPPEFRRTADSAFPRTPLPSQPQGLPSAAEIFRRRSELVPPSLTRLHGCEQILQVCIGGRGNVRNSLVRQFSSINERDDLSIEEDAERKVGWLLKLIFIGTAGLVGYQFFPYMGDNLLEQSIALLRVKDPLFKRMGASRLARFAVDDERRMKVVEMGGARELLNVLENAKDDKTRKQALKTLVALSQSDEAARFLDQAGAEAIAISISNSSEYAEIEAYKVSLLKRFQQLRA